MSTFGDDLIQSLNEALAHAKGDGPAILHAPVTPREVRETCKPHSGADGAVDGHESFRLPEMGARHAPGQWPGRDSSASDRKGTGGRQASIAVFGDIFTGWDGPLKPATT